MEGVLSDQREFRVSNSQGLQLIVQKDRNLNLAQRTAHSDFKLQLVLDWTTYLN